MSVGLHYMLAWASAAAVGLVGLEAARRVVSPRVPGVFTYRAIAAAVLLLAVSSAGGLALLLRGPGPRQGLHLMYGAFAFVTLPAAHAVAVRARPRARAVALLIGALATLALITRLFATG